MIRVLLFLVLVFALGLGFSWLADRPGTLVMTISGMRYEVTVMVAAVAVAAIVATVMISWWLLKAIWNSPRSVSRYFRARKRDRGYQSLSTGMIAAGAGDTGLARRMTTQASKLLSSDQEPLLHLLDAQAHLLEGDHEKARAKFDAMLEDPETKVLGLRGLFLEAQRLGDRDAARHYATRAVDAAPHLEWASNAALENHTEMGEWNEALALVENQKSTSQLTREEANRRRAVLLTAKAMAEFDIEPADARKSALEASKLAPDFVPAAVAAGQAMFRDGDMRKGSKLLEAIWKKSPHPDIADTYIHARTGDSTHDRLKRAERLASLKQNHVESLLAVARAAFDANEFEQARKAAEGAIRIEPREGAFLLMADIEEAVTGDQGRMRYWLSRAVRAPRDPAWTADGIVSDRWAPVSPVTGKLDAFEWKVPVEQIGPVMENADEEELPPLAPPPPEPEVIEIEKVDEESAGASVVEARSGEPETPEAATVHEAEAVSGEIPEKEKPEPSGKPAEVNAEEEIKQPLPDDPGVSKSEADEPRRFRLF